VREIVQLDGEDLVPGCGDLPRETDQPRLVDARGVHAGNEQDRASAARLREVAARAERAVAPGQRPLHLADGAGVPLGDAPRRPLDAGGADDEGRAAEVARHESGRQYREEQKDDEDTPAPAHRGG